MYYARTLFHLTLSKTWEVFLVLLYLWENEAITHTKKKQFDPHHIANKWHHQGLTAVPEKFSLNGKLFFVFIIPYHFLRILNLEDMLLYLSAPCSFSSRYTKIEYIVSKLLSSFCFQWNYRKDFWIWLNFLSIYFNQHIPFIWSQFYCRKYVVKDLNLIETQ